MKKRVKVIIICILAFLLGVCMYCNVIAQVQISATKVLRFKQAVKEV